MTVTLLQNQGMVTTAAALLKNSEDADPPEERWYRVREQQLIASLCNGTEASNNTHLELELNPHDPIQRRVYWQAHEFLFPAPPIGLGRLESYSTLQRIAIIQFGLFNWAVTEERKRLFGRRGEQNNLQTLLGHVPTCSQGFILPILSTYAQVYDLIPESAVHDEQLGSRCERPREALAAAEVNKARREAEAETYAAMQLQAATTPPKFTPDDRDYLAKPLRFLTHGPMVPMGSRSDATLPSPGAERALPPRPTHPLAPITEFNFSIPLAIIDDTIIDLAEEPIKQPEMPTLRDGDWICPCGTHNFAIRMQCIKPDCRTPKSAVVPIATMPMTPPRSALGDPGDWFCDFCGLCNWTRRTFCLRCCPLDPDNVEQALCKGVLHWSDPIIDILRLGEKRNRALKKKPAPGAHCACFGPHHGTRCPQSQPTVTPNGAPNLQSGLGVNNELWEQYLQAQSAILNHIRSSPSKMAPTGTPTGTPTHYRRPSARGNGYTPRRH